MVRTFIVLALLFGLSNALAPLRKVSPSAPDKYIVVFKKTANFQDTLRSISAISGVVAGHQYRTVTEGVAISTKSTKAITAIRKLKGVKFVEQDGVVTIDETALTWGLDRVNQRNPPLDGQTGFNGDGTGVNVYIIDTGIYTEHDYFGGRASVAYDAVGDGQQGVDCNGHGTHCAGTVGADNYGIARGANLFGIRVLNCYGSGYTSDVVAGMDYVAANGAKPAVASMSLGGGKSTVINDAVQALHDSGVPLVVSAGNSDSDSCNRSPAGAPSAITVGATDPLDYRAYFSCYGECVDIFAPGVNVLSTSIGSPTKTATYSGTSMACPHVAGAAAVALGNNPLLTPGEVWEKLKEDSTSGVVQDKRPLSPDSLLFVP